RLNPGAAGASQLTYSTYLGRGGGTPCTNNGPGDAVSGLTVDAAGNAYLTGGGAGFAMKINPNQTGAGSLVYAKQVEGTNGGAITVDSAGNAYVISPFDHIYANGTATIPPLVNTVQGYAGGFVQTSD